MCAAWQIGCSAAFRSTERHGISLQTLYRRSMAAPTLLVIRDSAGYVFGCFTSEAWRVATRFYGSGETFVFQLQVCPCQMLGPMTRVWLMRWPPCELKAVPGP